MRESSVQGPARGSAQGPPQSLVYIYKLCVARQELGRYVGVGRLMGGWNLDDLRRSYVSGISTQNLKPHGEICRIGDLRKRPCVT